MDAATDGWVAARRRRKAKGFVSNKAFEARSLARSLHSRPVVAHTFCLCCRRCRTDNELFDTHTRALPHLPPASSRSLRASQQSNPTEWQRLETDLRASQPQPLPSTFVPLPQLACSLECTRDRAMQLLAAQLSASCAHACKTVTVQRARGPSSDGWNFNKLLHCCTAAEHRLLACCTLSGITLATPIFDIPAFRVKWARIRVDASGEACRVKHGLQLNDSLTLLNFLIWLAHDSLRPFGERPHRFRRSKLR